MKKNKPWEPKPDFEAHVLGGFVRPYVCSHPGCGQAFSRRYTLDVHVKSHQFGRYHAYKKEPMLFFDPDLRTMQTERITFSESKGVLPPLVEDELKLIRAMSSSKPSRFS